MTRLTIALVAAAVLIASPALRAQIGSTLPPNADPNAAKTTPGVATGATTPATPGNGEGTSTSNPRTGCAGEIARADQKLRTVKDKPKRDRAIAEINRAKQRLEQKDEPSCSAHIQTALRDME